MKERNKAFSLTISIILAVVVWGVMAFLYDFYYDMNDDVLIKDILSGVYTGRPDGHNMQMQFLLGCIFAILYRAYPMVPWMGLIEVLLMAVCFVLIVYRASELVLTRVRKRYRVITAILIYIAIACLTIGCAGYEIVIIQYTFVCGVLALTAGILVATDLNESFKISNNVAAIILALLAFNFRSEMFLLMCPFLAAAGMYKWMSEGISRFNVRQYLGFVGIIIVGIVLSAGVEKVAYRSVQWQEFREFFDARTRVYDFTGIAPYEGNEDFYESLGMSDQDVKYLEEYNFTNFPATTYVLNKVADYSSSDRAVTTRSHKTLGYSAKEYLKGSVRILLPQEWKNLRDEESAFYEDGRISAPYNLILLILYLILIVAIVIGKDMTLLISAIMLYVMKSVSWIYVIYKDRVNARIAHPMYICEILLIIGMLLLSSSDYIRMLTLASIIICVSLYIPAVLGNIGDKQTIREQNNAVAQAVYKYTSSNSQNYFYLDVYTMTGCSEKIFIKREYGKGNTQLAGGWMAQSPLDSYKQSHYKAEDRRMISKNDMEDRRVVDYIVINGTTNVLKVYKENGRE